MANLKNIFSGLLFLFAVMFSQAGTIAAKTTMLDRAAEIRYTKVDLKKGEAFPKEIKINDVTYPLFKTKEEAVEHVKNMSLKSDVTVVYVASNDKKDTEILNVGN